MSTEVTPTSTSSHEDPGGAGWEDPSLGSYRELLPEGATRSFFWIAGKVLRVSRNHLLAYIHDPVSDQRRAWMRRLSDAGKRTDDQLIVRSDLGRFSFLLLGDPGEGDHSQYAVVPSLLKSGENTEFAVICSDVIYPAGDILEYADKFHRPYKEYPRPIYALPGNHDWYDNLQGFMYHFCGLVPPPPRPRRRWYVYASPLE